MAMAAAMATVSAALNGFPVFLVPHHAPDHQGHNNGQYCQYNECTHLNTSQKIYAAIFFMAFISSVLPSL